MRKFSTVDDYIDSLPVDKQRLMRQIRAKIGAVVPEATEVISYGMPAFKLKSVLVYYAITNRHVGFYPTSSGVAAFADELTGYEYSKGAIRLPFDQPIPLDLIADIVRFRVEEDGATPAAKKA